MIWEIQGTDHDTNKPADEIHTADVTHKTRRYIVALQIYVSGTGATFE